MDPAEREFRVKAAMLGWDIDSSVHRDSEGIWVYVKHQVSGGTLWSWTCVGNTTNWLSALSELNRLIKAYAPR